MSNIGGRKEIKRLQVIRSKELDVPDEENKLIERLQRSGLSIGDIWTAVYQIKRKPNDN